MELIKNSIVFFGSILVVIGSVFWGIAEGGYEPWIVALAGAVGIAVNWNFLPQFGRKKRKLTPEAKIALRDKWRPVFEEYFLQGARNGQRGGDVIVHDVDRLDTYPDTSDEKGISSWFRVGLMGTYHRGVLLGLEWASLEEQDGKWIKVRTGSSENTVKVMLLGEVRYEAIESVNFDGDDYYNKPHIYCHFDHNGEPYERLYYGEEFQINPGLPHHYREVTEYNPPSRQNFWRRHWFAIRTWLTLKLKLRLGRL